MLNSSKIVSVLFNFSMTFWFAYSFLFPKETQFWLMYNGLPILALEFYSIFAVPALGAFFRKETFSVDKKSSKKSSPLPFLIVIFAIAAISSAIINFLLFAYFLVSTIVRANKSKSTQAETETAVTMGASLIISAFIAIPLSGFLHSNFPTQAGLFLAAMANIAGRFYFDPGFAAIWGTIYFLLLIFFEVSPIKVLPKKGDLNYNMFRK